MVANKITLNGKTILDLSGDTVTPANVQEGVSFHLPSGEPAVGTMTSFGGGNVYIGADAPPENAMIWIDLTGDPTNTEEWDFELKDGTLISKTMVVAESED